ncbi:MAG: acylphosphatase [Deltaproteobacteria bacterium]|uniref:acylphosphatase n=1 Tax=Candidatus Zymogenus saltonus TaxID=2844893 RepID=A0A9D8KDJ8_9DELT|nr:acylphosphatase [Candidatus Zymogenus saltonus]
MVRARLIIKGRVQGVFYRYSTEKEAKRIGGLTGWVRNLPSGDVEVLVEGDDVKVNRLIEWCRKGPPSSLVTDVITDWGDYKGEFSDFSITY